MKGLRLALVGAYPPPYGGISTHVQRLADRCMQQGIDCVVFDYSRPARKAGNVLNLRQPVSWCRLLFHRFDIIHLHVSGTRWMVPACFALLARLKGARFVLTYHSLRGNFDIPGQAAMKLTLKAAARIIAMNTEIREKLSGLGAAPEKIAIAPSFLPPAVKEEDAEEVPAQTREFIANHTPVIAANAFSITEYQGADLYGIDMCLELVAALKRDYPRIGLVVFLSQPSNKARFADYQRRTRELDIA
ncbi:MAG: glycosyltransferase, partial [Dehalococcoidales bacterium]|nr:glycosyltransferase [Dehalococcoidales bacterium]